MGNSVKFKVNRCPNCNASVLFDPSKVRVSCEYCGSVLTVNAPPQTHTAAVDKQAVPTLAPTPPPKFDRRKIPPRPRINMVVLVLGFFFYFIPGIIYLINVLNKQNEWDKKYHGY